MGQAKGFVNCASRACLLLSIEDIEILCFAT